MKGVAVKMDERRSNEDVDAESKEDRTENEVET